MTSARALFWIVCVAALVATTVGAQPAASTVATEVESGVSPAAETDDGAGADATQIVTEEADSPAAEVSMLNRAIPLGQGQAHIEGDKVIWTSDGAYISGNAFIMFENMTLQADEVWTDMTKGLRAKGNVRLTVDEELTYADELVFDFKTKKGIAQGGKDVG